MSTTPSPTFGALRGPWVDDKGNPTRDALKKMQEWETKLSAAITLVGQIAATAKIQGRTEGIGTTASQLTNAGQLVNSDAVAADGATYGRIRGAQMSNGVVPTAFGKNLVPNPGFELNVTGTAFLADLALNASASDGWAVFSKNIGGATAAVWSPQLDNTAGNTGKNCLQINCLPGVFLPALMGSAEECRVAGTKIPIRIGDIVRIQAQERWDFTGAIPAGLTIIQRIGLMVFSAADVFIGELIADVTNTQNASFALKQGALQIPATLSGSVPAYVRVQCSAFITNTNAISISTSANLIAKLRWDDVYAVLQNTAFDVTPINTAATPTTTTPLSTQHGAGLTQVDVASSTWQYGDGLIAYNTGSSDPGVLGTYYMTGDDPTYSGGAVPYIARNVPSDANAANGRLNFGKIVTAAGVAASVGGGSGGGGPVGKAALL